MCTISWLVDDSGYHVFFNRDEQVTRPKGIAPQQFLENGVNALMPIDPMGQGTWVAVNEFGLSFALLNFYQGRLPKGRLVSRGQIIKRIAFAKNISAADDLVQQLPLNKYAPFSLLCFDTNTVNKESILLLRWTGKELQTLQQQSPLISSALNFETVLDQRLETYQKRITSLQYRSVEDHLNLHASHEPEASSYSICMHREDARTVSFSYIAVTDDTVSFSYVDGAPCETKAASPLVLARR